MNKSPAAILADSLAAGRVKQKVNTVVATETLVDNENHNELSKNEDYLNSKKDGNNIVELADDPENFWKTWSEAHATALKKCSSKDCACFEGLGSVM